MHNGAEVRARFDAAAAQQRRRTLIVNTVSKGAAAQANLGLYGYSYDYVLGAFLPLLERWAEVVQVRSPESQLDFAIRRARQADRQPLSLSFRPLADAYFSSRASNVVFPFWEFPDIPATDDRDNPRNNWLRIANRASLILTASRFTAGALARAGVRPPVRVVPVPIQADYFELPPWDAGRVTTLDCTAYVFNDHEPARLEAADPESRPGADSLRFRLAARLRGLARTAWLRGIKPLLPGRVTGALVAAKNAGLAAWRAGPMQLPPASARLDLSGVVYTTLLNPDDQRKNWQDILSAFLLSLGERRDATLVVKLVTRSNEAVRDVLAHYYGLGLPHRAKVAFVTGYLSDGQMRELALGSTYYLNASRAEGACLPLQDFLAAGRPGIAPAHTALADYFDDGLGFVVASQSEPCGWPHDDSGRLRTSWHRIDWSSLRQCLEESYRVARERRDRYMAMASAARLRMAEWASSDVAWSRLSSALELVAADAEETGMPLVRGPHPTAGTTSAREPR